MNKRSVLSLAAALVFALSGCESTTDNAASSDTTTEVTERAQDHSDNIEIANTTETSDEAVNIEQTEETVVPEQWNPEIPQRAELKDDGYICAVAYVGFVDADMDALQCAEVFNNSGYSSEFPMLSDIPQSNCIDDCQGYELYLVCDYYDTDNH